MQKTTQIPIKKATILETTAQKVIAKKPLEQRASLSTVPNMSTLVVPQIKKAPISQSTKAVTTNTQKSTLVSKPIVKTDAKVQKLQGTQNNLRRSVNMGQLSSNNLSQSLVNIPLINSPIIMPTLNPDNKMLEEQEIHPDLQKMAQNTNKPAYNLEKGLSFDIKTLHKHFQFNNENDQTLPVMISVKTLDTTNDDEVMAEEEQKLESVKKVDSRPSIDLICVIDNSGSMGGEKIKNVKTTLLQLIDMLNENDRLSLVLFNSYPKLLCNLRKVDGKNKPEFQSIINSIFSTGGTDIASGMDLAFKVMQQRKHFNPVSSVFLLSDGQDGGADERIKKQLNTKSSSLSNDCFTIHSFGFGSDHDGPLMNRICDLKDGNFYYVEQINQIDEFFIDALGGLFSVVAQDIMIEINLNRTDVNFQKFFSESKVSKTYGDMWKVQKQDEVYTIHINQLFSGISKDFIFEITVPKSSFPKLEDFERNIEVVKARLTAIPVDIQYTTKIVKDNNLVLTLFSQNETIAEDAEINDNVEFNYLRVKAAESMAVAIDFSEKQQFDQGQLVLEQTLLMIEKSHPKNKEKLQILKKDILDCKESAQPRVYENVGKYKMLSKKVANFKQSSQAVDESDLFQNNIQKSMVKMQKNKKC